MTSCCCPIPLEFCLPAWYFTRNPDKRLYVDENSAISYRFPERIEQIFVDGDDLYVLFESAAYAYSAASVNIVDRDY